MFELVLLLACAGVIWFFGKAIFGDSGNPNGRGGACDTWQD